VRHVVPDHPVLDAFLVLGVEVPADDVAYGLQRLAPIVGERREVVLAGFADFAGFAALAGLAGLVDMAALAGLAGMRRILPELARAVGSGLISHAEGRCHLPDPALPK
jgi:hypothetical protein